MKCQSVKIAQGLMLLMIVTAVVGTPILVAAPPSDLPATAPLAVRGEVVVIVGDLHLVPDAAGIPEVQMVMEEISVVQSTGHEAIQFHVNEGTQVNDSLKIGDTVEVVALGNGDALSIKKTE